MPIKYPQMENNKPSLRGNLGSFPLSLLKGWVATSAIDVWQLEVPDLRDHHLDHLIPLYPWAPATNDIISSMKR